MTAKNPIVDVLSAPLAPDWSVEWLANQVLDAISTEAASEQRKFVIEFENALDSQSRRLIRPLLAHLAAKSAAEAGTPVNLFGGSLAFRRPSPSGQAWILGDFENTHGRARLALSWSSAGPNVAKVGNGVPTAPAETASSNVESSTSNLST